MEAADVGGPPRNSGKAHVQACRQLITKCPERRIDIARPHQCTILLASCPRAAKKIEDVLLPFFRHAFVSHPCIIFREDVAHLQIRADEVTIVFKLIPGEFRLGLIQPENLNTVLIIILFYLTPHILAGIRVGRIEDAGVAQLSETLAVFRAGKIAQLTHLLVILALAVHGRPHRNHQLHTHLVELAHHGCGIRPILGIKFPVAFMRPVEEVCHDHIERNASLLIFACDLQQLLLGLITKLALPETKAILRHHGDCPRGTGVGFFDLGRCIPGGDPVIQLLGGVSLPLGHILSEGDLADRRIIPQHTVSSARKHERNARLRISLCQFQDTSLHIQERLLILAHAVKSLVIVRLDTIDQLIAIAACLRPERPGIDLQRAGKLFAALIHIARAVVFLKQHLTVSVGEQKNAARRNVAGDVPVGDHGGLSFYNNIRLCLLGSLERTVLIVEEFAPLGRADPEAVLSPRLYPQKFLVVSAKERIIFDRKHVSSPLLWKV